MTKERFIHLIEFIKERHQLENKLCNVLEEMSPGNYVDAFIYSEYETELLATIKDAMKIPQESDDIEYFMYELDFGEKYAKGSVTEDDVEVDFSSAEKLYEYLTKKYC